MKNTSEGFVSQNVTSSSKKLALGLGIFILGAFAGVALTGSPAQSDAGVAPATNFLQYFSGKQSYIDAMWSAFAAGDSDAEGSYNDGAVWGPEVNAGFT